MWEAQDVSRKLKWTSSNNVGYGENASSLKHLFICYLDMRFSIFGGHVLGKVMSF